MKKGKKVNTERKFFPGYMIMKMNMDDEIWHIVRTLPKVYGFLGGKKVSQFGYLKMKLIQSLIR